MNRFFLLVIVLSSSFVRGNSPNPIAYKDVGFEYLTVQEANLHSFYARVESSIKIAILKSTNDSSLKKVRIGAFEIATICLSSGLLWNKGEEPPRPLFPFFRTKKRAKVQEYFQYYLFMEEHYSRNEIPFNKIRHVHVKTKDVVTGKYVYYRFVPNSKKSRFILFRDDVL